MLQLSQVCKSFAGPSGSVAVLRDFSLEVKPGEFIAVMGPSGTGKTTLLLLAGGMLHPDTGQVLLGKQNLYALNSEDRARLRARDIGFVFQQFHLVPYLNLLENVLTASVGLDAADQTERADTLLSRFGLGHRKTHLPGQLSSGERQRAALARAFLNQPGLILADEPTGNLDLENSRLVLDHLSEYVKEGKALLLVTHDPRAAERADRVLELNSPTKASHAILDHEAG